MSDRKILDDFYESFLTCKDCGQEIIFLTKYWSCPDAHGRLIDPSHIREELLLRAPPDGTKETLNDDGSVAESGRQRQIKRI
jgi:hypothetical protein